MSKKTKSKALNLRKRMDTTDKMTDKKYNLTLGSVLSFGLIINCLICLFFTEQIIQINPLVLCIGSLIAVIASTLIMAFSNNTFVILTGYTILSVSIGSLVACSVSYFETDVVFKAIITTTILVIFMTLISYINPRFFLSLGKTLLLSLIAIIIINILFLLITGTVPTFMSFISVIIFALFIGYDWQKAQAVPKTFKNAILSAGELYLDIINIFLDLLELFDN
jgi:FtsH-binding integral membrane protein